MLQNQMESIIPFPPSRPNDSADSVPTVRRLAKMVATYPPEVLPSQGFRSAQK